mmetsp:Transcript_104564/g.300613  ORF Transcript_104564/g.300613 Transcript_104564/m.300613 type:complete len:311 (+) Transcript_104564:119-1051(+)
MAALRADATEASWPADTGATWRPPPPPPRPRPAAPLVALPNPRAANSAAKAPSPSSSSSDPRACFGAGPLARFGGGASSRVTPSGASRAMARFAAASCASSSTPGQLRSRSSASAKWQPQCKQYKWTIRRCVSKSTTRLAQYSGLSNSLRSKTSSQAVVAPSKAGTCNASLFGNSSRNSGGHSSLSPMSFSLSRCSHERSAAKICCRSWRCWYLPCTKPKYLALSFASSASRLRQRLSNSTHEQPSHHFCSLTLGLPSPPPWPGARRRFVFGRRGASSSSSSSSSYLMYLGLWKLGAKAILVSSHMKLYK